MRVEVKNTQDAARLCKIAFYDPLQVRIRPARQFSASRRSSNSIEMNTPMGVT